MANKFTREQHKSFGAMLKNATDDLALLQASVSRIYGPDGRERLMCEKTNTALLHLRTRLDAMVAMEYPSGDTERYYFGGDVANSTQSA